VPRSLLLAHPARVVVGGADASPTVAPVLDRDRLAAQQLGHALGVLARLGADRGDLLDAEHVHWK
jgi:hypothetical protein